MIEIINQMKDRFNAAFYQSSGDILDQIGVLAVANHMNKTGSIMIRGGDLARAVQDKSNDKNISGGDIVGVERLINRRYAHAQEKGNITQMTPAMRRAMFAMMKKLGVYQKGKVSPNPGQRTIPARPYIEPAIDEVNWESIVKGRIEEQFPYTVETIVIGNK